MTFEIKPPRLYKPTLNRRSLLRLASLGGFSSLLAGCGAKGFEDVIHKVWEPVNQSAQELLFDPTRLGPEFTPDQIQPDQLLVNDIRFNRGFFHPQLDPETFLLRVSSEGNQVQFLSLADLKALEMKTIIMRHVCIEGWAAIVQWTGIPLRALADLVGLAETVRYVYFYSADGYYGSWDLASALHPQTLLAYGMNGEETPPAHGGPLRLASPIKLGYKQSKWVTSIDFTTTLLPKQGYWEDQGYEWFAGL